MQDREVLDETWSIQDPVLERPVADLTISNRALNVFRKYGIKTIGDLVQFDPDDLTDLRGFGPGCLQETIEALREVGQALKPVDYAARR
jgi:DNA-directed RNA polymerase alpha subunit